MSEKVTISLSLLQDSGPVHFKTDVSLLCAVEVLIAFYENRLKDHYVVTPPVLRGLKALVSVFSQYLCIRSLLCEIKLTVFAWKCLSVWARDSVTTFRICCRRLIQLFFCCLPDKMYSVAPRFSCVHAEGFVPGCSRSGGCRMFDLRRCNPT